MNSHDLRQALVRGYARRTREHAEACLREAAGWRSPESPDASTCFGLALHVLVEAAVEAGTPREYIEGRLSGLLRTDAGWLERPSHNSLADNAWRELERSIERRRRLNA